MAEIEKETVGSHENEMESFPVEPRYHPVNRIVRKFYDFLASAKLAMFLLVVILACCLAGTTVFREKKAWDYIFSTLWFNALLVLLIVNVACCFFGRIWGRKITLISFGMLLFHLSFVTMFAGIVYNSLFYFRGTIRLTEGEVLPSGDPESYDSSDRGRFFKFTTLKGETSLIKLHTGYKVNGKDKRAAYEIAVGNGPIKKQEVIYITKSLEYRGFKYFPDKEGYSVLTILSDRNGREVYGAYLPLQSLRQNNQYIYTTGTKDSPSAIPFPQAPQQPRFSLNISYQPDSIKERDGKVRFQLYDLVNPNPNNEPVQTSAGTVGVGQNYNSGEYILSAKEIRYWTAIAVRYEPGQPIILSSLWVGLFGVILTTLARIFKKKTVVISAG